jgi:hypothetical protein
MSFRNAVNSRTLSPVFGFLGCRIDELDLLGYMGHGLLGEWERAVILGGFIFEVFRG